MGQLNSLLLALKGLAELSLDSLKIGNGLLSELEVSLNLPLQLLNITLGLLFMLQAILSLIQVLLKLSLDPGEVVALVLHSLDVLLSPLAGLVASLLLPLELGDHVVLVFDLLLHGPDLVILVSPVLLSSAQGSLLGLDLLTKGTLLGIDLGNLLANGIHLLLLALDPVVDFIQLLLDISGHGLNTVGLVNDVLDSGAAALESKDKLVLLGKEGLVDSLDLLPGSKGVVNVLLSNGDLLFIFSLVLGNLVHLRLGLIA